MQHKYYLPTSTDNTNSISEYTTRTNSIVIIGANGSGKSRLGIWMEDQNRVGVHRIGAQRSLKWKENLEPKSLEKLQGTILYGHENLKPNAIRTQRVGGKDGNIATMRDDIDAVLSAIFAKRTAQLEDFDERSKRAPIQTLKREKNIVDDVQMIWDEIYPHRRINFRDMKVIASINEVDYNGVEMSDGERVALYLIAQALLVPDDRTIIVDEPEIHLHRSIINRLWTALEKHRKDCLFIYITHDTEFAATHGLSDIIWCKSYDGTKWALERVEDSNLPSELLLELLGNHKKVIFVEGKKDSYDTRLYSAIYSDYHIVPCGGCSQVIQYTKSMKATDQLKHTTVFGIIDRDYRVDNELTSLSKNGIFALKVAEVENLLIVEGVLKIIAQHQSFDVDKKIEEIKDHVTSEYQRDMLEQTLEATIAEIKHLLKDLNLVSIKNEEDFKSALANVSFENVYANKLTEFNKILQTGNYSKALSVYNKKGVNYRIGKILGLDGKAYCELVIRLIGGEKYKELKNAIAPYLPDEIPSSLTPEENTIPDNE